MHTIERAFELAKEGQCRSVEDIRRRLKLEHYEAVEGHLSGGAIKRQLIAAMKSGPEDVAED